MKEQKWVLRALETEGWGWGWGFFLVTGSSGKNCEFLGAPQLAPLLLVFRSTLCLQLTLNQRLLLSPA